MTRSRKVAIFILSFCAVLLVVTAVGVFSLIRSGRTVTVPSDAYLIASLEGTVQDGAPENDFANALFEDPPETLHAFQESIARAKNDERIRGIVLRIGGLNIGWGIAQEIRSSLMDFKASGKTLISYLEGAEDLDYFIAAVADRIYLAPEGMLLLNGLTAEAQFFHDVLDKIGVEAEYRHMGKYKSAAETFTQNTMSPAHREAMTSILDNLYRQFLMGVAEGRKMTNDEVAAYIDDFAISGPRPVEARMVDGLLYYDQVIDALKHENSEAPNLIDITDYAHSKASSLNVGTKEKIALLYITGEIHSGESGGGGFFGGAVVGSTTIAKSVDEIRSDDSYRALIVRINSPGGSPLAADSIWRDLIRVKEKMPVIVSMSDLAASGGYWIATAGDLIVAEPATITGSIGVFMGKFNLRGLLDKVGVGVETISRGRYSEIFSPFKPFDAADGSKVDAMLSNTYESFLHKVAESRSMSRDEVDAVAQGRVWTGEQALEKHLVDKVGGLSVALQIAKERASLDEDRRVELIPFPRSESFVDRLLSRVGAQSSLDAPPELQPLASLLRSLETFESGPQVLLPFHLRIQ